MLVRYWQPWREMETLRRQLDQAFDGLTQPIAQSTTQPSWTPAIELKDEGDNFILRAQLPGMDAKNIDIQVTREAVVLSGEQRFENQSEEGGFFKSEFRYGSFRRVVGLPDAVQNDKVQADYKDGILSLTLPKVEEVRNKVVKVDLAGLMNPTPETATSEATSSEAAPESANA